MAAQNTTALRMIIGGRTVLPRLSDYVERFATERPDSTAVVCGERRFSYGKLNSEVNRWACALLAAGVGKGDRVAMLCTPRAEFWIAFLACNTVGAIWVGLNPRYSLRECDYVVSDAEPSILLTLADHNGNHCGAIVAALSERHPDLAIVSLDAPLAGTRDLGGFLQPAEDIASIDCQSVSDNVKTNDPAIIVYTSGSTGKPKGAVLSHYGLTFGATLQNRHFKLEHPSLVVSFPINHVASVADTCATTLVGGGKIVFQERFDAAESLRATVSERCTMMAGVPTMYQMQMSTPEFETADLSAVELYLWGGAAMPVEFIQQLKGRGKRLLTAYGMTETACHVTYTSSDASVQELAQTVGAADANCEIRFMTQNGEPASSNNAGELQVRGDFLMLGYWQRDKATRDAFSKDGWLRTGDLAYTGDDGNVRLVGRISDMFKSGGYNIYPREIERVLESHPAIGLAAVVAIADPLYQEVGVAYVQRHAGHALDIDALREWCRKRLANYKIPKRIEILDALPLLPVGKVDKQALREL